MFKDGCLSRDDLCNQFFHTFCEILQSKISITAVIFSLNSFSRALEKCRNPFLEWILLFRIRLHAYMFHGIR